MYKVGVIGLGNIAQGYGSPENKTPYCHVGGILQSKRVNLAAVVDISKSALDNFRKKWGKFFSDTRYYENFATMRDAEQLDTISICVRGPLHFSVVMEAIAASPRAIFLEKPPSCSLQEMDIMLNEAKAKGISITVSYSRHWCPHVLRLQELVAEGIIGDVTAVVGYNGDPFLSYASHTTDLICQFAGYCPTAVFARGYVGKESPPNGYEPEPILDCMVIEFKNGIKGIQIGRSGEYGEFYCDVIGTDGMIRAGMYVPPFARGKSGEVIDLIEYGIPNDESVFKVAYDQIAKYLDGGPPPYCTNEDFVAVNEIGFAGNEIGFAGIESTLTDKRIEIPNQNRKRKVFANG